MGVLQDQVAIVTGAGGTLGKASVQAMLSEGARVVGSDIDSEGLRSLRDTCANSERLYTHCCDVTSEQSVIGLIGAAIERFGGIDVMFNNAGVVGLEHTTGLLDLPVSLWETTLAVNLTGVMLGCKHAVPKMIERGGGSIINTASCAAFAGDVVNFAYGASKAGVVQLTRSVAAAYGQYNIRCNAIAPGIHIAEEVMANLPDDEGEFTTESLSRLRDHIMLRRIGTPEDVASVAVFLASESSKYITAQTLQVSGGLNDHVPHYADVRRHGAVYVEKDHGEGN